MTFIWFFIALILFFQNRFLKKAIKKKIQSETGATVIADALLNGLNKTCESSWRSTFKIELQQNERG